MTRRPIPISVEITTNLSVVQQRDVFDAWLRSLIDDHWVNEGTGQVMQVIGVDHHNGDDIDDAVGLVEEQKFQVIVHAWRLQRALKSARNGGHDV